MQLRAIISINISFLTVASGVNFGLPCALALNYIVFRSSHFGSVKIKSLQIKVNVRRKDLYKKNAMMIP